MKELATMEYRGRGSSSGLAFKKYGVFGHIAAFAGRFLIFFSDSLACYKCNTYYLIIKKTKDSKAFQLVTPISKNIKTATNLSRSVTVV